MILSLNPGRRFLPSVLCFWGLNFMVAQQNYNPYILVTPQNGGPNHRVETQGLNPEDKVFYRFSDDVDMTALNSAQVPPIVFRQFQQPEVHVSGFVAKKNGPFNYGDNVFHLASLPNVHPANLGPKPTFLGPNEKIRIKAASWNPFVSPTNPAVINDPTTTPAFSSPATPWFILPVTMKHSSAGTAEVTISENAQLKGVFLKNKWIAFNGPGNFTVPSGDIHVNSFTYSANKVEINFSSSTVTPLEFSVQFVVVTSSQLKESVTFSSSIIQAGQRYTGNTQSFATQMNPHDPNCITPGETSICTGQSQPQVLTYRVDFHNMGAGAAENVAINLRFDPFIISAPQPFNISSSHGISGIIVNSGGQGRLKFQFEGIDLPGLDQLPQLPYESCAGWVAFSVNSNTCIERASLYYNGTSSENPSTPASDQMEQDLFTSFFTFGDILFSNSSGFSQITPLNAIQQKLRGCSEPDPRCLGIRQGKTENRALEPLYYPNPASDRLLLALPAGEADQEVQLSIRDMYGRECLTQHFQQPENESLNAVLDIESLSAGLYLIYLKRGTLEHCSKFIKQ